MDGEACKGAPEVPAVAGSARGGGGAGDAAQEVPAVAASACGGGGAGDATQEVPAAAAGGHRTRVSDGKAAAQAANASGSSRTASLGAPESTSTFIADTATESTAARPASTSNARQALTGTPAAGERQVAKLTFVVLWLASFAACFHMLASLDELPPLDEAVPHLAGVLGGGLFAAAAALAVAGTTVLRGRVHVEWHRGRMYIQLGVPSEGPSAPAGSVEVRPTPDRGNGAFATAAIPAGSHLTDYEGEVINDATFRARYNNGPGDYCIALDDDLVIDAAHLAADTSRFTAAHINHSRTRANVARFYTRRACTVSFFAARDIAAGEELLYDYGRQYWRGREHLELP